MLLYFRVIFYENFICKVYITCTLSVENIGESIYQTSVRGGAEKEDSVSLVN